MHMWKVTLMKLNARLSFLTKKKELFKNIIKSEINLAIVLKKYSTMKTNLQWKCVKTKTKSYKDKIKTDFYENEIHK